ncbi:MAG: PGPGW domain-containing protein [Pirellulaceae bacterium]
MVQHGIEAAIQFTAAWGVWLMAASAVAFFSTLALVPIVLVRLPDDYLLTDRDAGRAPRHPVLRWTWRVLKNLLGAIFVLGGVIMLVTPGQGVLSIVIGLTLLDFPGRKSLERRILGHGRVLRAVNAMRARWNRPPLRTDA